MNRTIRALAVLGCLTGCNKKDDAPKQPEAKPEAKKDDPKPEPKGCGAGEVGGGEMPFCLKVPAGYVAGKVSKSDDWSVDFGKPESQVVIYTKWSDRAPVSAFASVVDNIKSSKDKIKEQGELAGGNGYFAVYIRSDGKDKQQYYLEAEFKGSKYLMTCAVSWWTDQPDGQPAADACKTFSPR